MTCSSEWINLFWILDVLYSRTRSQGERTKSVCTGILVQHGFTSPASLWSMLKRSMWNVKLPRRFENLSDKVKSHGEVDQIISWNCLFGWVDAFNRRGRTHQANVSFIRISISSLTACSALVAPKSKSVFGVFHLHGRPKHVNLRDSESEVQILIRSHQNLHFIFFYVIQRWIAAVFCIIVLLPECSWASAYNLMCGHSPSGFSGNEQNLWFHQL